MIWLCLKTNNDYGRGNMKEYAILHGKEIEMPDEYKTLAELLVYTAKTQSNKGIGYIDGRGNETFVSYPQLLRAARRKLHGLLKLGFQCGDVSLLLIDEPRAFHETFWACILGGIVPAPIDHPTSWTPHSQGLEKLYNIWGVAKKPILIIEQRYVERYQKLQESEQFSGIKFIAMEELDSHVMAPITDLNSDDLAFLQFSSGSTGNPKGVKLTHRNIILNTLASGNKLGVTENDITFTWLPHTHDMGIFGQHIIPILKGSEIKTFSPYTFIRSPYLFLQKISEYRGTWFCSPNFGYDWMTEKIREDKLKTLDLSSLRLTLNGAEPISAPTMRRFAKKFSVCGYRESMMLPAYGMAETTVGVSISEISEKPTIEKVDRYDYLYKDRVTPSMAEDALECIHLGEPIEGLSIRVVNESNEVLREHEIGEIQLKGDSVTSGYYNLDSVTNEALQDGWLSTGDLGYVSNGSIIVSGRKKEIIFIRGMNYFAQDLESVVYAKNYIPRGNLAAVGMLNEKTQTEEVYMFVKHKRLNDDFRYLKQHITQALQEVGIEVKHVIPVKRIPTTTSGKIQRFLLRENLAKGIYDNILEKIQVNMENGKVPTEDQTDNTVKSMVNTIRECWSTILHLPSKDIGLDDEFFSLGGNSIKAFQLLDEIESTLNRDLGTDIIVLNKTVRQMADYIASIPRKGKKSEKKPNQDYSDSETDKVAVTGLAVRLPQAETLEEFWNNLNSQTDCVQRVSEHRKVLTDAPEWDDWIAEVEHIDMFDPTFFNLTEKEAKFMDPQQRLALETSHEALEDAGITSDSKQSRNIGVYGGISSNTYHDLLLKRLQNNEIGEIHPHAMIGSMQNMICSRISQFHNFTGPSVAIDTACSSFLVAFHHAVEAVKTNQTDGAIALGTNIMVTPDVHTLAKKAGISTSTKYTKVFDEDADGSVLGEGVVVVYVEPLEQAIEKGKTIYGVVQGSAINNDGESLGQMTPDPKGQLQVLQEAYASANVALENVGYIETHGSGTAIGDPIELNALGKLFPQTIDNHSIGIGSVKSNIGHLLPVASGAGLVKVLLSLYYKRLVPNMHLEKLNPLLELEDSPFYVVQESEHWKVDDDTSRIAGISSFGLGGTNAHVVLKEWRNEGSEKSDGKHLLTFSAKTSEGLNKMIKQTARMTSESDVSVKDLCYTRNRFRNHYGYRAYGIIDEASRDVAFTNMNKGSFLRKRSATIGIVIGDMLSGTLDEMVHIGTDSTIALKERKTSYKNQQTTFQTMYNVYENLSELIGYCNNKIEIVGVGSGKLIADVLNGKMTLKHAMESYESMLVNPEEKEKDMLHSSFASKDIIVAVHVPLNMFEEGQADNKHSPKIIPVQNTVRLTNADMYPIIGDLYIHGANVDWERIYPNGSAQLTRLPTYPFERKSIWIKREENEK